MGFSISFRFIYTDDVHLDADNVMRVMYASKKYMVTKLTMKCTKFLEENLCPDTAAQLLEQSIVADEKELKAKALKVIQNDASEALSSESFTKLSHEALSEVLLMDLKISNEVEVFKACLKWAEYKCQELEKSTNGANIREVLGNNLFLVRFPTMTVDDFNNSVLPHDVLTAQEGLQVLRYLTVKSGKPGHLPFSTEPRGQSQQTFLSEEIKKLADDMALVIDQRPTQSPQQETSSTPQKEKSSPQRNPTEKAPVTDPDPSPNSEACSDPTPYLKKPSDTHSKSMIVPAPYATFNGTVGKYNPQYRSTNLTCKISKPIMLQKIFVHALPQTQISITD